MQHYISNYTKGFRESSLVVRCALRGGPVVFASLRVVQWSVSRLVRGGVMRCAVLSGLVVGCVSGLVVRCAVVRGLVAQWSLFLDELVRCVLCVVQCSVTTHGALRNP